MTVRLLVTAPWTGALDNLSMVFAPCALFFGTDGIWAEVESRDLGKRVGGANEPVRRRRPPRVGG
jgi:hypothetical protein